MLYALPNINSESDHHCHYSYANKVVEDEALRDRAVLADIVYTRVQGIEVAFHHEYR
jgi:hypothetical protein